MDDKWQYMNLKQELMYGSTQSQLAKNLEQKKKKTDFTARQTAPQNSGGKGRRKIKNIELADEQTHRIIGQSIFCSIRFCDTGIGHSV